MNRVECLRERHVLKALMVCEACGRSGAKASATERVFDVVGIRPRVLCTNAKKCVARVHAFMAEMGEFTGEVEETWRGTKKIYKLHPEAERMLSRWRARCYRGIPQWILESES